MDIKDLQQIINILKENGVTEFELQQDGTHIKLTRGQLVATGVGSGGQHQHVVELEPPLVGSANGQLSNHHKGGPAPLEDGMLKVESPIVGTFYRKPAPDSNAFVEVGDTVKKGDTLCIVEAMKLMNEIESPHGGTVEKILVSDGQLVEYGEIMFLIRG